MKVHEERTPEFFHKQVAVQTPWGESTAVDEGLVELLALIWKQGYQTQYSCQGGREPASVSEAGGQAQPSIFTIPPMFGVAPQPSDAHIIFTRADDGYEFLTKSVKGLEATQEQERAKGRDGEPVYYASSLDMLVMPPVDGDTEMRADVRWLYLLTPKLVEVWS